MTESFSALAPTCSPLPTPSTDQPAVVSFRELGLVDPLLRALRDEAYERPTPIQAGAIPLLLEGRDLLACARTGTGKTAAFALPILQRLAGTAPRTPSRSPGRSPGAPRVLVLVPTRELAAQVHESFLVYGRHLRRSSAVVYGGVGQGPQVRALRRGVEILVATPGRLLDLVGQGHLGLGAVEVLVLDEADQMLDLGFLPAMERILRSVPARRQTLLFSATMPPPIAALAQKFLTRPARLFVTPPASTVESIEQRVHFVESSAKTNLLAGILSESCVSRALVFTRTKRGADKLARRLGDLGIRAEAIHGNKSQGARERALDGFRRGRSPVLVATDIAARGIDVDGISHVVNYELPNVPESYVHRIGRTARAGASGVALTLCAAAERGLLRDIERLIGREVPAARGTSRPDEPKRAPSGRTRSAGVGRRPAPRRKPAPRAHLARPSRPEGRREPIAAFGAGTELVA